MRETPMAANPADQELPRLDDEDDVAESTVAMESPSFDPVAAGVSSPISVPPPAVVAADAIAASSPDADAPFAPAAPPAAGSAAAVPTPARGKAPSTPLVATPIGGIVPQAAPAIASNVPAVGTAPPPAAGPPPAGSPAGSPPGASAPPPVPRTGALASPGAFGGPGRVRPQTVMGLAPPPPGAPRPPAPSPPAAPPRPASSSAPPAVVGALPRPSSLPSLLTPVPKGGDPEAATVAVPREKLRGPSFAMPASAMYDGLPRFDDDESTQSRQSGLPQLQDAYVVSGDEVGGDDATLAVPLGDHDAKNKQLGAHGADARHDEGGLPGALPVASRGSLGGTMPPPVHGGRPSWPDAAPWGQAPPRHHAAAHDPNFAAPDGGAAHASGAYGAYGSAPTHGATSPMRYPASPVPAAAPGMSAHPGGGHAQYSYQGQGGPMMMTQPGQHAAPWGPPVKRAKISGQIWLLAIVGVICLTIFFTGIALFFTTKL